MTSHLSYSLRHTVTIGVILISDLAVAATPEYPNGDASITGKQIQIGYSTQTIYNGYNELTFQSIKNVGSDKSGIEAMGGAFRISTGGQLTISNNDCAILSSNTVVSAHNHGRGGAIYSESSFNTDIFGNRLVAFESNQATAYLPKGGAIYGGKTTIHNNELVIFKNNQTKSYSSSSQYYTGIGGAICLYQGNSALISNNESVSFESNKSEQGGAVYARRGSGLRLQNNGDVSFVGNIVHSETSENVKGAAIYGSDSTINISNNNSVIFRGNAQITDNSVVLRSIYLEKIDVGYGTASLTLSANTGGEITFYDSIYIGREVPITLNNGTSGNITFTGESTYKDLGDLFTTYAVPFASSPDYEASRTSELLGTTTLSGGKLIIKEKAILNISKLTVADGSITVATGAQLNLSERDITMPSLTLSGGTVTLGTEDKHTAALTTSSLTVTDNSTLNADLILADNGSITFDFSGNDAKKLTMGCSVSLGDNYRVYLDHATIALLMDYNKAEGITLMDDIESMQDILLSDCVCIYDTDTDEQSGILLYTQTESNGTMSLKAVKRTPEPATATLSLLALAALITRRRRQ